MPLYDLQHFQHLVREGQWDYLNLERTFKAMARLGWTDADVAEVLCGLTAADFQKTVPNCKANELTGNDLIDADQYLIHWDEVDRVRVIGQVIRGVYISLKIAIAYDQEGEFAGLVVLHPDGMP